MLLSHEIAEEYPVEEGISLMTPDGPKRVKTVFKTVPMPVWVLRTKNHELRASGHHLVRGDGRFNQLAYMIPGDMVETDNGDEEVISVERTDDMEEMYDVTIESDDGVFYTNGIVSHNSTTFAARQLMYSQIFPGYRSLYVVPYPEHMKTYARRYLEMERAFRGDVGKQNVYNKVYANGSTVDVVYALTDAAKVRGKTADECVDVDSLVLTDIRSNACTELKNLKPGDKVVSWDAAGKLHQDEVVAYAPKGKRPCWKINMSNGETLICTSNHKLGTTNGWVYVADLLLPPEEVRKMLTLKVNFFNGEDIQIIHHEKNGVTDLVSIETIEYVGVREVGDIQVKDNACFFANNALVHNCLIDEAQSMDPDIIPEILYVQTTSKIPSTIYAGTALSVDTLLEAKWSESSHGVWHMRAMDGKHWLNMYDKDTLLKVCDNPQGPTCPYTGKPLRVENGLFVHENKQALAAGDIGIHIPQCIIPDIAYNPVHWGKVYRKVKRDDFKKVLQECFGIAVAEGSREISEADLMRLCVLSDTPEQLREKCRTGYYRLILSGCDWGGSDYNQAIKSKTSYTVHVIIGVAPDGAVDILHWRRHSGMDYPEIASIIVNEHNAWSAHAIATDFGVGMAYNMEIRNSIPADRHFIMGYVGPASVPLAEPKGQHMANQLSLNRTEALTNVFSDIKSSNLRIRCRNWDDMAPFLLDFLNMHRIPVDMPGGANMFKYVRSATKADDALHAFTFAYVLAKFYLGEPLVRDESLEKKLRAALFTPQGAAPVDELAGHVFGEPVYVVSG